ncbi:hypothetical protein SKAU_G00303830 [Synaphobranchus kaupii]|uniref:Uncharacterized protein n=1 Tax=Synaphobranchus kaupii TaxID=118154 RepID=A0A9Q1EW88_SYNKA|nr:hypothetical protein SKAU_G00303830 [Synaphobranchus kaupii]
MVDPGLQRIDDTYAVYLASAVSIAVTESNVVNLLWSANNQEGNAIRHKRRCCEISTDRRETKPQFAEWCGPPAISARESGASAPARSPPVSVSPPEDASPLS